MKIERWMTTVVLLAVSAGIILAGGGTGRR